MTTTIKVKIQDLTPKWIAQLQQKHGGATLEIKVHVPLDTEVMDEVVFWSIIDTLDWTKGYDTAAILAPSIKQLKQFSIKAIFRFQDLLAEKLYALDQQIFAENLGSGRYGTEQYFSVDSFLYARAAVVANGKKFYEAVLNEPSKMPKEYTFEGLLYLAAEAFQEKTGKDWNYLPKLSYETFSNRSGWGGKSWMDSIFRMEN